jgi:hypothetical protein
MRVLTRGVAAAVAFVVGWAVYMVGMVLTVYDGCLSLLFQPIMAALWSSLTVAAALASGLILRLPGLRRWWRSSMLWAASIAGASLFLLVFGYALGLRSTFVDPESGVEFQALQVGVAIGAYFALLFAIANWPAPRRRA